MAAGELERDLEGHGAHAASGKGDAKGDKKQHQLAVAAVVVGIIGAVIAWLAFRKSSASSGSGYTYPTLAPSQGQVAGSSAGDQAGLSQGLDDMRNAITALTAQAAAIPVQNAAQGSSLAVTNTGGATNQVGATPPRGPSTAGRVSSAPAPAPVPNTGVYNVVNAAPVASRYYTPSATDIASGPHQIAGVPGAGITWNTVSAGPAGGGTAQVITAHPELGTGPTVTAGQRVEGERYAQVAPGRYRVIL